LAVDHSIKHRRYAIEFALPAAIRVIESIVNDPKLPSFTIDVHTTNQGDGSGEYRSTTLWKAEYR
jgi:hypothetical protein